MDDSSRTSLVEQFTSLTGVDDNRANFFLESANWNFELAIQTFYENSDNPDIPPPLPEIPETEAIPEVAGEEEEEDMSDDTPNPRPVPPNKDSNNNQRPARPAADGSGRPNIATISSLRENRDNEPHGQAFYAGGSEHSGQQVLGPQGRKSNTDKIVSEMFKQAKENAEVVDRSGAGPSGPSIFTGSGFTLGTNANDSRRIGGPSSAATAKKPSTSESDEEEHETILKLWSNGFSLDDGALRTYDDPQNQQFLAAIRRGEIPSELSQGRPSREVCLSMEDHRHEEYQPPKKKPTKAFGGEGHRLGTPASEIIAQTASAVASDPASKEKAAQDAQAFLNFDQSQPNTRIQIRLADGSRMVVQINLSRLVSDLRQYICIARPEYAVLPFNLMTTFPNKVIENESASIQESGLANSSLVQRLV